MPLESMTFAQRKNLRIICVLAACGVALPIAVMGMLGYIPDMTPGMFMASGLLAILGFALYLRFIDVKVINENSGNMFVDPDSSITRQWRFFLICAIMMFSMVVIFTAVIGGIFYQQELTAERIMSVSATMVFSSTMAGLGLFMRWLDNKQKGLLR